jgi:hypothetical protein
MLGCRRLAHGALTASVCLIVALSPVGAEPRAVLELFTSQGCSSCPPADTLLGELAKDDKLIAVSFAIDYWDYIGWKDTLADPRYSARQKKYAKARGDRAVYTPQMVINGTAHAVGSDRTAIERAIAQSRQQPSVLTADVSLKVIDGQLAVTVAPGKAGENCEIWVGAVAKSVPVAIKRGENRGKTITYHNVVRSWRKVGEWNGDGRTLKLSLADIRRGKSDGAVAFIQGGTVDRPGAMRGAAMVSLP